MTWRRSAVSCGANGASDAVGELGPCLFDAAYFGYCAKQELTPMTKRQPQVLSGLGPSDQVRMAKLMSFSANVLSVLPKAELLEPFRNLLHRGPRLVPLAQR